MINITFDLRVAEIVQIETATTTAAALFAAAVLLGDHGYAQAHQRADVGGVAAVETGDIDQIVFAGQPGHHLHDARVGGFGQRFDFLQQRHFGG